MAAYSKRVTAVLAEMAQSSDTSDTFTSAVQLVAKGCQQAYELAELPGLLTNLKKVSFTPDVP